ncbi:hypothetical protein ABR738_00925 [Streptomyces sp. Edi4]|uniref:hypothetical protein n=1 Tax=Streptomyces sp. Edi4 TaxID=3162527 RepID=UPI003306861F
MDHHLEPGQVYRACAPADGPPRYVRILEHHVGGERCWIADAATGKRERDISAGQLHEYAITRNGTERRKGYVHVPTHDWLMDLVDRAQRGHPNIIDSSAVDQDARRGGILLLRPKVPVEAVRAVAAALEAAGWTVEPALEAADVLRVRFQGQSLCPARDRSSGETWFCGRARGHSGDHQDDRTGGAWDNEGVPERIAWWLPGRPLPGGTPASA